MAYDHTEQEQIDALKAWWKQYGNAVTWLMIVVLSLFVAWKGWGVYQTKQAAQASVLFEELQKAIKEKDQAKVLRIAADVQVKYPSTNYAQMISMLAAKSAFDQNDLAAAKNQLMWVKENGKTVEFKTLAKIRLAGVLLDEKAFDDALKLLAGEFPAEFVSSMADRKGDILVAQNKFEEARTAYQVALKAGNNNPDYQYIQLKLDAIGGMPVIQPITTKAAAETPSK